MKLRHFAMVALLSICAPSIGMADEVRSERVQFKTGTSGATLKGSVTGYDTVEYLLGAQAGQVMSVTMAASNASTYFNIFAPGVKPGEGEAMYIGSINGIDFQGALPKNGDYIIQVYQMRSAARRGEKSTYAIDVAIGAKDSGRKQGDALVAGTDFNATGEIGCALSAAQPMQSCGFGVRRMAGDGNAEVEVSMTGGDVRVIVFQGGAAVSSDGTGALQVSRVEDLNRITIGDERYEIPDAVIYGG